MKIQCEVCEKAEAEVLCCADEAVLCGVCDRKVHTANKLSLKHQRLSLLRHCSLPSPSFSSSSSLSSPTAAKHPMCDICQERNGYFFCLEDRAILCKKCDMSIHQHHHLRHQRFIIGGIKVSLDSSHELLPSASSSSSTSYTNSINGGAQHNCADPSLTLSENNNFIEKTATSSADESLLANATAAASWPLDENFGDFNDFNYYDFSDMKSSRITGQ